MCNSRADKQGILRQPLPAEGSQSVYASAEIHRLDCKENPV
jgi:hypothetical protein